MQFSTIFDKFIRKFEKKPRIYYKKPVIINFSPKHNLKLFVVWMGLMKEEDNINELIDLWFKGILNWVFGVFLSGFLIQLALTPFFDYILSWMIIFNIFALGIGAYVISRIWNGVIDGLCRFARSFPKK